MTEQAIQDYARQAEADFAQAVGAEGARVPPSLRAILREHIRVVCLVRLTEDMEPLDIRRAAKEITDDFIQQLEAAHSAIVADEKSRWGLWRRFLRRLGLA